MLCVTTSGEVFQATVVRRSPRSIATWATCDGQMNWVRVTFDSTTSW